MRNVRKLIADAGGPKKIAAASEKTDYEIEAKSVYDWPRIGIPERHWPILAKLAKASAEELHRANNVVRAKRSKPSPKPALVGAEASEAA